LVDLARICLKQALAATRPEVAAELHRMARECQSRATKLNNGIPPGITEENSN
jgi:hypothetical protein